MVQKYVVRAGIRDQGVIAALGAVPRHLFVEAALAHQAYSGASLPIGFGQTISHPTTVALMTRELELSGSETVLEIGTGSGYQAAVLAEMGVKVFSIERIPELALRAKNLFGKIGYHSIAVRVGDGHLGWPQFAPYDRIVLTAHSKGVPMKLIRQLAPNGILVIPVGNERKQKLIKVVKNGESEFKQMVITDANFVPLVKNNPNT